MKTDMFRDLSPFTQLVIAGLIVVGTSLVVLILGALLAIPFFDYNYFSNPAGLASAMGTDLSVVKFFQIISSLGTFVLPPFVIAKLYSGNPGHYLSINKNPQLTTVLLTGAAMIAALPIIGYTAEINAKLHLTGGLEIIEEWMRNLEDSATELTAELLKMDSFPDFMINLFMIAIIPAVGEELLFRGVIQKILTNWFKSTLVAVVVTAFLFSAFHFQFLSFLPRFLLGIFLGYLLVWTKNIWIPIIAHFVNNASAVVYYYISGVDVAEDMANPKVGQFPIYLVLGSLIVFFLLVRLIVRKERQLV